MHVLALFSCCEITWSAVLPGAQVLILLNILKKTGSFSVQKTYGPFRLCIAFFEASHLVLVWSSFLQCLPMRTI